MRIIASTNRDLEAKIKDNSFREDLFYRLNVLSLHMPPLEERPEDVPCWWSIFSPSSSRNSTNRPKQLQWNSCTGSCLIRGAENVRELENVIGRAVLLSPGDEIHPEDLDWKPASEDECLVPKDFMWLSYKEAKRWCWSDSITSMSQALLLRNNSNVTRAAKDCGLERQALQQVMRRYGIKSKDFQPSDDDVG